MFQMHYINVKRISGKKSISFFKAIYWVIVLRVIFNPQNIVPKNFLPLCLRNRHFAEQTKLESLFIIGIGHHPQGYPQNLVVSEAKPFIYVEEASERRLLTLFEIQHRYG